MQEERSLSKIESNCNQLLNSPYMQKEVPPELKNLRTVLEKVATLVREDVPALIAEIRHLRTLNRRLEAELESSRAPQSMPLDDFSPSPQPTTPDPQTLTPTQTS